MRSRRLLIYLAGFVLPPIMYGLVLTFATISRIMIHEAPAPLAASGAVSKAASRASGRPRAVFLLSGAGTQIMDLLGPAEVLGESGLFELVTVSAADALAPTTADLAIVPDFGLDALKPEPGDVLVIPAVVDPSAPKLIEWLKRQGPKFKSILVCGEGARLALAAGLLSGHSATSHFVARDDLLTMTGTPAKTQWIWGPRYVVSGNLISSAGIAASVDAAFALVEQAGSAELAKKVSFQLGYIPSNPESHPKLEAGDFLEIFLHAGYDWSKKSVATLAYDGASELGLAAALDLPTRTYSAQTFSLGSDRRSYVTRHGIHVVPGAGIAQAPAADLLIVPSGIRPGGLPPASDPPADPAVHRWVVEHGVVVKSQLYDSPGKAIAEDDAILRGTLGPKITDFAAKLAVYAPRAATAPGDGDLLRDPDHLLPLWAKPIGVGLAGLLLAWLIVRKLRRKLTEAPGGARPAHSGKRA